MRIEMNSLELAEREAAAEKCGAEKALRALRSAMREVRAKRLSDSQVGELPELEIAAATMLRAVERCVGGLERELDDARERFCRSPTEQNLMPVRVPANDQTFGKAVAL